ncbi:MAG: hypothetical protein JSW09_07685 [Pseudomonadota bacterium]|nr:MAG: hypothetical protein JSW09_07685 [Pseudomonadota bacterium]
MCLTTRFGPAWVLAAGLLFAVPVNAGESILKRPIDPFDYSYCGGQPVYPVIGINFATFCGPRNQVALGRRGELMWTFPSADGQAAHAQGRRKLNELELKRLSLLAEVTQFSDPTFADVAGVNYQMGVDFQGRQYKRLHAVLTDNYTPANELFRAMLALVPDKPLMPACAQTAKFYSPTVLPDKREPLAELPRMGYVSVGP